MSTFDEPPGSGAQPSTPGRRRARGGSAGDSDAGPGDGRGNDARGGEGYGGAGHGGAGHGGQGWGGEGRGSEGRNGGGRGGARRVLAGETPSLIVPLLLGVLIAVLWRALLPSAQNLGDEQEVQASVDGTLAGLGLVAGLLTGVYPLLRPGRTPVRRVLALIVTCTIGAVIAWQLGDQLDNPELQLRTIGTAFIWPATTAVVIMLGAILPWTSRRLELAARPDLFDENP